MKVKKGIVLTSLGNHFVAVPTKGNEDLKNVIRLNETGAMIWRGLEEGLSQDQIAEKIVKEYTKVDKERALQGVHKVIKKLEEAGFLEE